MNDALGITDAEQRTHDCLTDVPHLEPDGHVGAASSHEMAVADLNKSLAMSELDCEIKTNSGEVYDKGFKAAAQAVFSLVATREYYEQRKSI